MPANIIYFFLTLYLASTPLVTKNDHPITLQILLKYHNLLTHSFNIIFCWLPSHVGIPCNEKAAKPALNKPILRIPILYTDLEPIINSYIHDMWQQTWNSQTQNKVYQIYTTIPSYSTLCSSYQRIGHTRLTQFFSY